MSSHFLTYIQLELNHNYDTVASHILSISASLNPPNIAITPVCVDRSRSTALIMRFIRKIFFVNHS